METLKTLSCEKNRRGEFFCVLHYYGARARVHSARIREKIANKEKKQ